MSEHQTTKQTPHPAPEVPDFDIQDWLDGVKRPEAVVNVCQRPDLAGRVSELDAELAEKQQQDSIDGRLGGSNATARRELAEKIEAAREEMRAASRPFRLRGLSRDRVVQIKTDLKNAASTSGEEPSDDALKERITRECIVSPEMTPEQFSRLREALGFGQFEELLEVAVELTVGGNPKVPFSLSASAESEMQTS